MIAKWILSTALLGVLASAQPADDSKPATTNVLNAQYPRVYPDGRANFRLAASNAAKVQLAGAITASPLDMAKGEMAPGRSRSRPPCRGSTITGS